jgi:uncharacterized protein
MKRSKLKRRLRKKFHVGEFRELGFEVTVEFKPNFNGMEFDQFWREFIGKIEKNKLVCGGGGNHKIWQVFVTSSKKYQSPTDEQRENIKSYLESLSDIAKCEVGKLRDAWYDIK